MSTDFNAACLKCKTHIHLGQRYTNATWLGYSGDDDFNRAIIAEYIEEHVWCRDLMIVLTDDLPEGSKNVIHKLPDFHYFARKENESFWRKYDGNGETIANSDYYEWCLFSVKQNKVIYRGLVPQITPRGL